MSIFTVIGDFRRQSVLSPAAVATESSARSRGDASLPPSAVTRQLLSVCFRVSAGVNMTTGARWWLEKCMRAMQVPEDNPISADHCKCISFWRAENFRERRSAKCAIHQMLFHMTIIWRATWTIVSADRLLISSLRRHRFILPQFGVATLLTRVALKVLSCTCSGKRSHGTYCH